MKFLFCILHLRIQFNRMKLLDCTVITLGVWLGSIQQTLVMSWFYGFLPLKLLQANEVHHDLFIVQPGPSCDVIRWLQFFIHFCFGANKFMIIQESDKIKELCGVIRKKAAPEQYTFHDIPECKLRFLILLSYFQCVHLHVSWVWVCK